MSGSEVYASERARHARDVGHLAALEARLLKI